MIFNMMSGRMKTPALNASYPANATVTAGTSATFSVAISEDGMPATYTYQWYVNGVAVSGATGPSYTRSTTSDKGQYTVYCQVTNAAGTVTSRTATLTVNKTPVLSTGYPADAAIVIGSSVTCKVSVATAGYPTTYTYQWYKNGDAVSGATSATYTFTPTAVGSNTVYCKVRNSAGTVQSRTATITVTARTLSASDFTGGLAHTTKFREGETRLYGKSYTDKIDLSIYKTITFDVSFSSGAYTVWPYLYVTTNTADNGAASAGAISTNAVASVAAYSGELPKAASYSLDISNVTGSYYLVFYTNSGYGSGQAVTTFSNIKLT